jgi:hypothetical protein
MFDLNSHEESPSIYNRELGYLHVVDRASAFHRLYARLSEVHPGRRGTELRRIYIRIYISDVTQIHTFSVSSQLRRAFQLYLLKKQIISQS